MIRAVDLYAGAGGASEGLLEAATARGVSVNLTAVNHWPTAVATHTENHPTAQHFCMRIDALDPRIAVPGRKLDILVAAPECTHHSTARGGKPINDQSRAGAWQILHWLDHIRVEHVLIENVPEFRTWGPLNSKDRPIKSKKGDTFRAFINALEQKGYTVEYRVLNAADYGAATTRRRLFIQARRGKKPINWPEPTHSKTGSPTLFGGTKKWRAAREIIDWEIQGESIFKRKKPLAPATMRRIMEGLRRFSPQLEPFLVVLRNHMDGRPLTEPVPTIAAEGQHLGLAQPFIVPFRSEDGHARPRVKDINDPLQTVTTENPIGLAEPIIYQSTHGGRASSIDGPMPTVTGANRGELGIAEPFMVPFYGEREGQEPRTHSVNEPVPTIPTDAKFGVVEPLILPQGGGGVAREIEKPIPTVHGDGIGLIESEVKPFLVIAAHGEGDTRRVKSLDDPLGAVTGSNRFAVAEPFVVAMEHGGRVVDIEKKKFKTIKEAPRNKDASHSIDRGFFMGLLRAFDKEAGSGDIAEQLATAREAGFKSGEESERDRTARLRNDAIHNIKFFEAFQAAHGLGDYSLSEENAKRMGEFVKALYAADNYSTGFKDVIDRLRSAGDALSALDALMPERASLKARRIR